MNKTDVVDLLTLVTAGDRRTVGENDVEFWYLVIGDLPKDLAMQAVRDHFRQEPGVWLEPGHIAKRVRARRNDMLERETDYHRDDYTPHGHDGDSVEDEADRYYPGDLIAADDPPPYPRDWTAEQRLTAYWESVRVHATPRTTAGWAALCDQARARGSKRVSVTETHDPEGAENDA